MSEDKKVPWYRQQWLTVVMAVAGWLAFKPLLPVAVIYMWTGPVYYKKKGALTTYSMTMKIILSAVLIAIFVGWILFGGDVVAE